MKILPLLIAAIFASSAFGTVTKREVTVTLPTAAVRINVYEKSGPNIVLFVPHANETAAARLAKDVIARSGGRLIEIVNNDSEGRPARYLRFSKGGRTYQVDPNRIFTPNGRGCAVPQAVRNDAEELAARLVELIFDGGRPLAVIAVHNNTDSVGTSGSADLTAHSFIAGGRFSDPAAGVFLSNTENDPDSFVYLTRPADLGHFAAKGFNVVLQRPSVESARCSVDDGSFSIFAAKSDINYICLESDQANADVRQKAMLDAVFELFSAKRPSPDSDR